jgi:zinc D-Ala-D-Ala carboxypeptidase
MNLTSHFTLDELTFSQYASRSGLKNEPNAEQTENLRVLCERVLQPLRNHLRRPVVITSGFRSPSVNRA